MGDPKLLDVYIEMYGTIPQADLAKLITDLKSVKTWDVTTNGLKLVLYSEQMLQILKELAAMGDGEKAFMVELTYFKESGKYYSEGRYASKKLQMYEIFDEVELMRDEGRLPGLVDGAKEFHVLVNVPGHPNNYPAMIVYHGNSN